MTEPANQPPAPRASRAAPRTADALAAAVNSPRCIRRARRIDSLVRLLIAGGGISVILCVVLILVEVTSVAAALFLPARARLLATRRLPPMVRPERIMAMGCHLSLDGRFKTVWVLTRRGEFVFIDMASGRVLARQRLVPGGADATGHATEIMDATAMGGDRLAVLGPDGAVTLARVEYKRVFARDRSQRLRCSLRRLADFPPRPGLRAMAVRAAIDEDDTPTAVELLDDGRIVVRRQLKERGGIFGDDDDDDISPPREDSFFLKTTKSAGPISDFALDSAGSMLWAVTGRGTALRWLLREGTGSRILKTPLLGGQRRIDAACLLPGDMSLVTADASGGVLSWGKVGSGLQSRLIGSHVFPPAGRALQLLAANRNKSFFLLERSGNAKPQRLHMYHLTTERRVLRLRPPARLLRCAVSAADNCLVGLGIDGRLFVYELSAPHADASLKVLLSRVLYEGYRRAQYMWQSTGGGDFEPKYSLVPLVFGTVKGTCYAMLLAIPLALLGAIYTSQFADPACRRWVKPAVEVMAAVPSVVVGFLAALWLAPLVSEWIVAFALAGFTIPLLVGALLTAWRRLARGTMLERCARGREFLLLPAPILLGAWLAIKLDPLVSQHLFNGDFTQWLFDHHRIRLDQRNCIVIAFGLGFTSLPVIFSLAEDSLWSVPHDIKAASIALGASRWQTAWRVTLPAGSPGVFAGIMLGFGRAVGETMIVLMAAGNTPLLDWSPFNGMRTLAANIAVEIPEAPVGGTLFRILFLCAVLLFGMTFMLNTASELIRQHLREKYGRRQ